MTDDKVIWYRSGNGAQNHAVTDAEFARMRGGVAEAVCGHSVLMVSHLNPPGPRCEDCARLLTARRSLPTIDERLADTPEPLWRRLFKLPGRSSAPGEGATPS